MQRTFVLAPYSVPSRLLLAATRAGLRLANALERGNDAVRRFADVPYGPGARQRLDVYVPAVRSSAAAAFEARAHGRALARGPWSVAVFVHGGYWTYFGKDDFAYVGRALAERGLVAVVPAYRRYPHVGLDAQLHDVALAVRWAVRRAAAYGGARGPLTLVGHSSGAHLAALLALDPARLRCVGLEPDAVARFVGVSGPYDFALTANASMAEFFGPPARHARALPVNHGAGRAPPALLVHGLNDALVRPQNTRELARRLRDGGGVVIEHLAAGDGHGSLLARWTRPRRRRDALLAAVARFAGAPRAAIMRADPRQARAPCTHRTPERSPSS